MVLELPSADSPASRLVSDGRLGPLSWASNWWYCESLVKSIVSVSQSRCVDWSTFLSIKCWSEEHSAPFLGLVTLWRLCLSWPGISQALQLFHRTCHPRIYHRSPLVRDRCLRSEEKVLTPTMQQVSGLDLNSLRLSVFSSPSHSASKLLYRRCELWSLVSI